MPEPRPTTKEVIAAALKEMCRKKPFDKVSVSDIAEYCGLNRQTFYYHFQDKYELLNWIYYHENLVIITEGISFENWNERMFQMLQIMRKDKAFYRNTLKGQEAAFHRFLFEVVKKIFLDAIDKLDANGRIHKDLREFDAEFYSYGICGMIISWVNQGMIMEPEKLVRYFKKLSDDTLKLERIQRELSEQAIEEKFCGKEETNTT